MKKLVLPLFIAFSISVFGQVPDSSWSKITADPMDGSQANSAILSNGNAVVAMGHDHIAIVKKDGSIVNDTSLSSALSNIIQIYATGDEYWIVGQDVNNKGIIYHQSTSAVASIKNFTDYSKISDLIKVKGNFYALGQTFSGNKPTLLKLDANYDTIFTKNLYINSFNEATDIHYETDGELNMAGFWDDYPAAWKYDTTGNEIWRYDSTVFISFTYAQIQETSTGYTYLGSNYIMNLDHNGKYIQSNSFKNHSFNGFVNLKGNNLLWGSTRVLDTAMQSQNFPMVALIDSNLEVSDSVIYKFTSANQYISGFYGGAKYNNDAILLNGLDRLDNSNKKGILLCLSGGPVGILTSTSNQTFNLYPNPTSNNLNINAQEQIHEIRIIDLQGKIVQMQSGFQSNEIQVELKGMEPGIYIVKIQTSKGAVLSRKLIVE